MLLGIGFATIYLVFSICPSWYLYHHIKQGLFVICIQWNVVEWRNDMSIFLCLVYIQYRFVCLPLSMLPQQSLQSTEFGAPIVLIVMPSAVLLAAKTDGIIEPKKSEQTKVEDTVSNFMSKQIQEKVNIIEFIRWELFLQAIFSPAFRAVFLITSFGKVVFQNMVFLDASHQLHYDEIQGVIALTLPRYLARPLQVTTTKQTIQGESNEPRSRVKQTCRIN